MKKAVLFTICLTFLSIATTSLLSAKSVAFKENQQDEEYENYEDLKPAKETIKPKSGPDMRELRKNAKSRSVKIVALVNGEMISSEDIENRINAFVMTTQIPVNSQTEHMIFQRVLHNAIDEKLKIQTAQKNGITISKAEIDDAIRTFEANNRIPEGQLASILKESDVSEEVFRTQIESDLAWVRLVRKKMAADMDITQKEIEEALEETQKDLNTPKYLVSEILIKKGNAKNLTDLVTNLRQDPRFELYAMQFSESPSAAGGGNLGWINKGKMPPKLEAALAKLKDGQISDPIETNGDFVILKRVRSFDPEKDDAPKPNEEEIKKFLENQKLETFATRYLQQLRQTAIIELRN